ncbi:type II secretion system F family protein [Nocardiopsis composta]|uniref:Tight adherence protein B n=2 Tax=Nocardiopsis composta TaxID=157465 RepID=A0A7W8VF50_9ACTN|nr:type II secretion system F family protein [Nocardiopsis composta]MBB5433735.1 tight adherence protein B [Nocardiopsis composta]
MSGWWPLGAGLLGLVALALLPSRGLLRLRAAVRRPARRRVPALASASGRVRARLAAATGRTRARGRRATVALCRVFAAELRSGRPPGPALASAAAEAEAAGAAGMAAVAAAGRSGADPGDALRRAAAAPGCAGMARLAVCWTVAARSGAGLADVAERLAAALDLEEGRRRELSAQLAGPRTTALLLAVLPAAGLGMAGAMGGGPVAFLFATPAGLGCLAAGVALDAAGLYWVHRMVRRSLDHGEPR